MSIFFLGTHHPGWLAHLDVPLFISARRLRLCKKLPRAMGVWSCDSGGFSELKLFGEWRTSPKQYVREVRLWWDEVSKLEFAAIQSWMAEPFMLEKTGLSVQEHQRRTITSYLELRDLAPELPWLPVLQGWEVRDYLDHLDQYARAGVNLAALPLVGLGSVCRRQATAQVEGLIARLALDGGLKLHVFGMKQRGLLRCQDMLASADSMAWSFAARHAPPLPGHETRHKNCANCSEMALLWREKLLARLERARLVKQWRLF